jgi:cation transporter-like permease
MSGISTAAGAITGFLLGIIVDVIAAIRGIQSPLIHSMALILTGVIAVVIGIWLAWKYVHWIFRAKLGPYRLALVHEGERPAAG